MNIKDLPERFQGKIEIQSMTGCWLWQGAGAGGRGRGDYGRTHLNGRQMAAHRAVYLLLIGEIEFGMVLDHLCLTHRCVNPEHLEPVSTEENNRRAGLQRRQEACHQGHPMSGDNLGITPASGSPYCRQCQKIRNDQRYSLEYNAKRRQQYRESPEIQERSKEYRSRPETKKRAAAYQRRLRQTPEGQQYLKEYRRRPEVQQASRIRQRSQSRKPGNGQMSLI